MYRQMQYSHCTRNAHNCITYTINVIHHYYWVLSGRFAIKWGQNFCGHVNDAFKVLKTVNTISHISLGWHKSRGGTYLGTVVSGEFHLISRQRATA